MGVLEFHPHGRSCFAATLGTNAITFNQWGWPPLEAVPVEERVVVVVVVVPPLLRPPRKEEKPPDDARWDVDGAGANGLRDAAASVRRAIVEFAAELVGFPVSERCARSLIAADEPERAFTKR